jgi:hypothetical protein
VVKRLSLSLWSIPKKLHAILLIVFLSASGIIVASGLVQRERTIKEIMCTGFSEKVTQITAAQFGVEHLYETLCCKGSSRTGQKAARQDRLEIKLTCFVRTRRLTCQTRRGSFELHSSPVQLPTHWLSYRCSRRPLRSCFGASMTCPVLTASLWAMELRLCSAGPLF